MPLIPPHIAAALTGIAAAFALIACDQSRMENLHEGLSTETDVRQQLGAPEMLWEHPDGSRTLEYPRQPMGHRNYMITIGPDGRMQSLRQVLAPHIFKNIQPGMSQDDIRQLLGKPARRVHYALRQETEWEWNWMEHANREMELIVTFAADGRVLRHRSIDKPRAGTR